MKIVFMGTPEFAVPGLKVLIENQYDVVGVVTAPDKPQGRGKKIKGSAIKEFALEHQLRILQPTNLKSEEFHSELKSLNADLFIVVAFRMLPESVWKMPPMGTFNLHGSLLPHYRGAAPIHWAVINGETKTGLTTFFLKHEIDTGNIILQEEEQIQSDDTTGSLYVRLMHKGADLILKTVKSIESGTVNEKPQVVTNDHKEAPKLSKENTEIDWNKSATVIYNMVRGLNPFPSAWTHLNEKYYKIHEVKVGQSPKNLAPGEVFSDKKQVFVGTGEGSVELILIQPEGKRKMYISEFLAGNSI